MNLDELAAPTPTPGAGGALAETIAIAAALVEMTAGISGVPATVELANASRAAALELGAADARIYTRVIEAATPAERDDALRAAAEPPLKLAELAETIAELASEVAANGKESVRGDALAARALAEAAGKAARTLADINIRSTG